tara:strand:+ start:256 stop:1323 length:1068 start_codon:yes stop_codon:yes gene_type:complete
MRKLGYIFTVLLCPILLKAQIQFDVSEAEQNFIYNLNLYANYYIDPVIDGFNNNQVIGWQQTGRTIRKFSVRFGLSTASTFVRPDMVEFDFYKVGFTNDIQLADPDNPILPTVMGGETDNELDYTVTGYLYGIPVSYTQRVEALDGVTSPNNAVPNAVPQLSLGLPYHFEITGRIFPNVSVQGVKHMEYGFGLKHQISQYIVGDKSNFHWNVGGFYNQTEYTYVPEMFLQGENQEFAMKGNALLLETTASYDWKFLTAFAQLGYFNAASAFNINGTYRYELEESTPIGTAPNSDQIAFEVVDPVEVKSDNNGVKMSVGATIRVFKVVSLSGSYNYGKEYSSVTANLSFNILTWDK